MEIVDPNVFSLGHSQSPEGKSKKDGLTLKIDSPNNKTKPQVNPTPKFNLFQKSPSNNINAGAQKFFRVNKDSSKKKIGDTINNLLSKMNENELKIIEEKFKEIYDPSFEVKVKSSKEKKGQFVGVTELIPYQSKGESLAEYEANEMESEYSSKLAAFRKELSKFEEKRIEKAKSADFDDPQNMFSLGNHESNRPHSQRKNPFGGSEKSMSKNESQLEKNFESFSSNAMKKVLPSENSDSSDSEEYERPPKPLPSYVYLI